MMLKNLWIKYKDILLYILFGAVTTGVNYLVYMPLYNGLGLSATLSNMIAWAVSVLVAFLTNKPFVFHSNDWSWGVTLPELWKFVACRIGSGVLETVFIALTVDVLSLDGNIMKLIISVAVVAINYVGSKLLFTHKEK